MKTKITGMIVEIKVPDLGVNPIQISRWLRKSGDLVEQDEPIAEVECDKATVTIDAPVAGKLDVIQDGSLPVATGWLIATVDTSIQPQRKNNSGMNPITDIVGRGVSVKNKINVFEKFTELIDIENPKFENTGKVHDWRNYVPYDWQKNWFEFTERERQIIAVMAETQADKEEWS